MKKLVNELLKNQEEGLRLLKLLQAQMNPINPTNHFDDLKKLLDSSQWPAAVPAEQIVNDLSEDDKLERAKNIEENLFSSVDLNHKKFLDLGCGEGHMAKHMSEQTTEIVCGYDLNISSSFKWNEKQGNLLLTSDWEQVIANGPYDFILLYDVIDHVVGISETELLIKAKSVLSTEGTIYMRCHPWCSRHGSHLYRQLNKAFVHLVFTITELKELGYEIDPNLKKVIYPILTYNRYIQEAGLTKVNELSTELASEPFFENNSIVMNRIMNNFQNVKTFPSFQLKQCFIDYILKH